MFGAPVVSVSAGPHRGTHPPHALHFQMHAAQLPASSLHLLQSRRNATWMGTDAAPQQTSKRSTMFSLIALYFAYRNQTVGAHIAPVSKTTAANDRAIVAEFAKAA